jgi:hypothetical protein
MYIKLANENNDVSAERTLSEIGSNSPDSTEGGSSGMTTTTNTKSPTNWFEAVIGTVLGPLVVLYGNKLQSIICVLNAAYAANLFGLLGELQEIKCPKQFDPTIVQRMSKVSLSLVTIAVVGLKKGSVDLILKVGVVSAMMQDSMVKLLSKIR